MNRGRVFYPTMLDFLVKQTEEIKETTLTEKCGIYNRIYTEHY